MEYKNTVKEMQGVETFVFTLKEGVAAKIGHNLKLRAEEFSFFFNSAHALKRAVYNPEKIEVFASIKDDKSEGKVGDGDKKAIKKNMFSKDVLDVAKYKELNFDVTKETDKEVEGMLTLHGTTNPLKCTKELLPNYLSVKCAFDDRQWGMKQFSALFGTLKLKPDIVVEVQVPRNVWNNGKWWF